MQTSHWSRKLKGIALASCAIVAISAPRALRSQSNTTQSASGDQQSVAPSPLDHTLSLYNTHTNERMSIVYRHGDSYVSSALSKLDYFLRDHNTNEVRHFDPHLYDILADLTASVGRPNGEIDIVCGYRTPATNAALR